MVFVRAFESEYQVIFADNPELLEQVHRIRYQVYCEEFGFEKAAEHSPGQEIDEFDAFSHHYLIKHKASDSCVGTIRMVRPRKGYPESLPIAKHFLHAITSEGCHPVLGCNSEKAEIGRLAVLKEFRNQTLQNNDLPARLKTIPIVVTALYLAVAAECRLNPQLQYAYLVVEPRLARHLKTLGICFEQIGPVMDFRGNRAPFVMQRENWKETFRGQIDELFQKVVAELQLVGVGGGEEIPVVSTMELSRQTA